MVAVPGDRETLRATFESAADIYHEARPDYPEELFDFLTRAAAISPGDRLLEIGCGTGKATIPLARRGLQITALEMGPGLAAAARRNLATFPDVEVVEGTFESWQPAPTERFDVLVVATAWHWLDPATRNRRAWELLREDGRLAVWSAGHVVPATGDPFFAEIQSVYDEIGEGLPGGSRWFRPGELPDGAAEIEQGGVFEMVLVRRFDWEVTYDAEGYVRLLDTFSSHIAMDALRRERLYSEIRRRLAERPDGRLRRHWEAVLHLARAIGQTD